MPRILSQKAQAMLADVPPYLANDPSYQSVIVPLANELQRLEDTANAIRAAMIPPTAGDVVLLNGDSVILGLSLLETVLDLPVAPAGVSIDTRRATVMARIRTRNSGSGADWVALITQLLGSSWSYFEG